MELLEGTSGYSYKEWKGTFYPADLPAKAMLAWYAERLPAVEINNTFYRLPKADVIARWRDEVPERFRFVIKASRRITHIKRLVDAGEETSYLLQTIAALGERLGGVLFQLPPFLKCDLERLSAFVASLPDELPATFEFRHASWESEAVRSLLRDAGYGICVTDTTPKRDVGADAADGAQANDGSGAAGNAAAAADGGTTGGGATDAPIVVTGPHAYLRLRAVHYTDAQLESWLARLRDARPERAFVFFKHEDEATGPALAARLRTLYEAGEA